ncbi:palmitoyltransferase [Plakobranchus ocellatus]|uniref:Palmitoyltransferase n=1 Tax=Plakobranchus ocellatus TaxID=259542 RepID=A0AAV4AS04_9GAST|nr:palmitoyltransferase [Plakobranchus ocellatus]
MIASISLLRSIVFGPPGNTKAALIFFLVTVVLWGYPMYLIKCLPVTWNELQIYHVLFLCTNVIMWICLYHSNSIDPGFLPRNIPEYDLAIKQVAHFDEWKQGQNPLTRLCHTCRTVKPLRAKHCRVCNRCVKEFDHHCPYIHNCVGYYNRVYFLAFLCTLVVLIAISNYFMYYIVYYVQSDWLTVIGTCQLAFFSVMIAVVFFMSVRFCTGKSFRVSAAIFNLMIVVINVITYVFDYHILEMEGWVLRKDYIPALAIQTGWGLLAIHVNSRVVSVALSAGRCLGGDQSLAEIGVG